MNNNEPIVIGKVKKNKTGKPLVVLILFLFIGSVVLFLPTIANYFGDYNIIELVREGKIIDFFINHDNYKEKLPVINNELPKENKKLINHKTEMRYNNITLSKFNLTKNEITFEINTDEKIDFNKTKYYLVLTKNNKVISNIKLLNKVENTKGQTYKFVKPLENSIEIYGEIKIIQETEYPKVILHSDETGLSSLTCTLNSDKIEYMFNDNKLINIKETYNYKYVNSNEYHSVYQNYILIKNKINNNGGTSTLEENIEGFTFKTNINLNITNINLDNYYSLNTKPEKVNFEMIAKGYDCK